MSTEDFNVVVDSKETDEQLGVALPQFVREEKVMDPVEKVAFDRFLGVFRRRLVALGNVGDVYRFEFSVLDLTDDEFMEVLAVDSLNFFRQKTRLVMNFGTFDLAKIRYRFFKVFPNEVLDPDGSLGHVEGELDETAEDVRVEIITKMSESTDYVYRLLAYIKGEKKQSGIKLADYVFLEAKIERIAQILEAKS